VTGSSAHGQEPIDRWLAGRHHHLHDGVGRFLDPDAGLREAMLHAEHDGLLDALGSRLDTKAGLTAILADQTRLDLLAQVGEESLGEGTPQAKSEPGVAEHDATAASGTGDTGKLTVSEVAELAIRAHNGQTLGSGGPWSGHLRVVAEAMTPFGPLLEMAGWLHDILEQSEWTKWTADELRAAGVPDRVVEIVERVTHIRGREDPLDRIRLITQDPEATLVKIADNADSIRPGDGGVLTPARQRLLDKWEEDRKILWPAATTENITAIVGQVNPRLLEQLTGER
jgi:hypothetical protein